MDRFTLKPMNYMLWKVIFQIASEGQSKTPVSYNIFFLLIIQIVLNTSSFKKKDVEGKNC